MGVCQLFAGVVSSLEGISRKFEISCECFQHPTNNWRRFQPPPPPRPDHVWQTFWSLKYKCWTLLFFRHSHPLRIVCVPHENTTLDIAVKGFAYIFSPTLSAILRISKSRTSFPLSSILCMSSSSMNFEYHSFWNLGGSGGRKNSAAEVDAPSAYKNDCKKRY